MWRANNPPKLKNIDFFFTEFNRLSISLHLKAEGSFTLVFQKTDYIKENYFIMIRDQVKSPNNPQFYGAHGRPCKMTCALQSEHV